MAIYGYLELGYLTTAYLAVAVTEPRHAQVKLVIAAPTHHVNVQSFAKTDAGDGKHAQVDRAIGLGKKTKGVQVRRGAVVHEQCADGGYLQLSYLTVPYLGPVTCGHLRVQVSSLSTGKHPVNAQVNLQIVDALRARHLQVKGRIDAVTARHVQVDRINSVTKNVQVKFALYNAKNLRVMHEFPSRGTTGLNWTSNSTASGDFSVNNVNTDIVEQVWRSTVKTGIILTCDTQISQGIFLDTLAILNHNLTVSATVTMEGSNDPAFGSIGFTQGLTLIDEPNIYYIAPTLPQDSYRYWRFIMNDPTNPLSYLQVGTIVFGTAIVFQGENIVDTVGRTTKHFADKIATEGFTNVSNDRALKFMVNLDFKFIAFNRGNYKRIASVFKYARTSLKTLWIPTPEFPERFACFGKLSSIPTESHNVKGADLDFINFSVEIDESL